MFNFRPERVNFGVELGKGSNGVVYPYQRNTKDDRWVVKHILAKDYDEVQKCMQSIILGFNCDHPAILATRGYHMEEVKPKGWHVYIKQPRMHKSLQNKLNEQISYRKPLMEEDLIKYLFSIASGLDYLHKKNVAHCDIKPSNILLDKDGNIKLTDIAGRKVNRKEKLGQQNKLDMDRDFAFVAPEVMSNGTQLKKRDYYKTDSWSVGVVMAELCLLSTDLVNPFLSGLDKEGILRKRLEQLEMRYSKEFLNILYDMLQSNPIKRKTMGEVKKYMEDNFGGDLGPRSPSPSSIDRRTNRKSIFNVRNVPVIVKKKYHESGVNPAYNHEAVMKNSIEHVKEELERRWEGMLRFNVRKPFEFEAADTNRVDDKAVCAFIDDMAKTLEANYVLNLEKLGVSLKECKMVTDQSIEDLSLYIGTRFQSLKQFTLRLNNCKKISDHSMEIITTKLGTSARDLDQLTLDFSLHSPEYLLASRITDKGVTALAHNIGANLTKLTSLDLNFTGCQNITDDGLKEIANSIMINLKGLKKLSLNFSWCNKITDEGLRYLTTQIETIKNLKHFSLNFSWCKLISDYGVRELAAFIGSAFKGLNYLSLNFAWCDCITDRGVKELTIPIGANLKTLQHLNLDFTGCIKISEQVKNIIKKLQLNI